MNLGIQGERDQGQDVRTQNVTAVMAIANIVKNSLGPQGLDKMLVDDIGDVTITNDGATILQQLEVEHPAAKVIVELSQLQDKEVGDGTTSVVILAAELLKRANDLIANKVHPTAIIQGYKMACREACSYIQKNLCKRISAFNKDELKEALINCAKTSMSSKLIGSDSTYFSELCVDAIQSVKTVNSIGDNKYPVKSIHIEKVHGLSTVDSTLIKGYALMLSRASQQMPVKSQNAKIACLDLNLHKFRMLNVQISIDDPKNLEKVRQREMDILKERIEMIAKAGATVILTTKGIDDIACKYMVEKKIIGLRRIGKADLRRIAKSTGATIITTLATNEGEEFFESSSLGQCDEVYEENLGDQDFAFFKGLKKTKAVTLVLRGPNDFFVEEVERSIHDSLCVLKRALESDFLVAGGGAVETALSMYLDEFSRNLPNKEQIAISEFAEALLIIPIILANNAAQDATELLAKMKVQNKIIVKILKAFHYHSQHSDEEKKKELKWVGLDLVNGKCRNNLKAGVLEPMDIKVKCLRFATEAAISILRIDDMIKLAPEKEELPQRM